MLLDCTVPQWHIASGSVTAAYCTVSQRDIAPDSAIVARCTVGAIVAQRHIALDSVIAAHCTVPHKHIIQNPVIASSCLTKIYKQEHRCSFSKQHNSVSDNLFIIYCHLDTHSFVKCMHD